MTSLAITGATGRLGGRVAHRLAAAEIPQRLIVRDPARAPQLPGAQLAMAEYGDTQQVRSALAGAATVLMVSAADTPDRVDRHRSFVDEAVAAGVEHVVYTSFYNASATATFTLVRDHWATEQYIRGSGLAFTFLRDNLYADFLPLMVGDDGVIRGPGGDGRAAVVAQDDIAEAAVGILRSPREHAGRTYELTGPESISFAEAAAVLSRATGRSVTYQPETLDEAYASRAPSGAPRWQLDAWVTTYTAVAAGELDGVSDDIALLTGHPATSLAQLLNA